MPISEKKKAPIALSKMWHDEHYLGRPTMDDTGMPLTILTVQRRVKKCYPLLKHSFYFL